MCNGLWYTNWKLSGREENPKADLPSFAVELGRNVQNGFTKLSMVFLCIIDL